MSLDADNAAFQPLSQATIFVAESAFPEKMLRPGDVFGGRGCESRQIAVQPKRCLAASGYAIFRTSGEISSWIAA
jgi:hypothetical protein